MTDEELQLHVQEHSDHSHIRKISLPRLRVDHDVCHRACNVGHKHDEDDDRLHNPFIGAHPDEDIAWEDI